VLYDGVRKISKSDQDKEIHPDNRTEILIRVLKILKQKIAPNIKSYKSILEHAIESWDIRAIPKSTKINIKSL
jgi:glutamyl-Q tRNA(Asp) synthetase